jgi:hypothetical protein
VSARYAAADVSSDGKDHSGLSLTTLMIASASSVAAAIVVSRLWGAGTLFGAALTPVIVALVSEGLHRPAKAVSTVRQSRTQRYDPVAEGRRGMREGDLDRARPARPGERPAAERAAAGAPAPARTARARERERASRGRSRRPLMLALATGLVAFVIGAVVLTGTELVFGDSAVSGSSGRTTLLGGRGSDTKTTEEKTTSTEETAPTTTTVTQTTTQATPTTTAPTTTTNPGVVPQSTSPGGTPAPPATTTAPAPAPSSTGATPPATTTP